MSTTATAVAPLGQDARVIGVVSLAHGTSHFFHLLLPPLFPVFIQEFALSYSELGLLVSLFFLVSSIGQALAGFLVDRIGARVVLYGALGCFFVAALVAASAQGYAGLAFAAVLAGVGNAPFHPVDFTILNKRVSAPRLGHAFSVHGISGNLGWAAAPVCLVGLSASSAGWRVAYLMLALWVVFVLALVWLHRELLDDRAEEKARERDAPRGPSPVSATPPAGPAPHPLAFLRMPVLWMCFAFFLFSTFAMSAIQGFAGPALGQIYGLPISVTASVLTGYMLFGAVGMLIGGFVSARVARLELTIGLAMAVTALLLLVVSTGWLPGPWAAFVAALAGLGSGIAGPSRDLLIRQAAPPGATGRVYGTVYAGFDVGFTLGAPLFGWMMDRGWPHGVFGGAALAFALGIAAASWVGIRTSKTKTSRGAHA
jgi:FSR family fosmidomycin resistance protein-like MFS transporter